MKTIPIIALIAALASCTTIDTSKSFWGDPSWIEPHDGMDNGNPASINPPMTTISRCFKRFPTAEGSEPFKRTVYKIVENYTKKGIGVKCVIFIPASYDGILWRQGDIQMAVIYFEEEQK